VGDYTVAADEISVHRKTTEANVADTVTFAVRRRSVEVINLSADPDAQIWFSTDGNDPEVDGSNTVIVPAGGSAESTDTKRDNVTVVRLISEVPATYSVTAAAAATS
jgi:hypothetical protein